MRLIFEVLSLFSTPEIDILSSTHGKGLYMWIYTCVLHETENPPKGVWENMLIVYDSVHVYVVVWLRFQQYRYF